jgi:Family of unknown function (DUF5681)
MVTKDYNMHDDTENKLTGEFPEAICDIKLEMAGAETDPTIPKANPKVVAENNFPHGVPTLQNEPKVVFEVGYCKPPQTGYFVKGVSGNPRGRTPGSKNRFGKKRMFEFVREEGEREVAVREGGDTVIMPTVKSVVRSVFKAARGGSIPAAKLAFEIMRFAENEEAHEQEKDYLFAKAYKKHGLDELEKNPGLKLIPDPNDISFDERHRMVVFSSPRNEEEIHECEDQKFEQLANPDGLVGGKRDHAIRNFIAAEEMRTGIIMRRTWPDLPIVSTSQYED